MADYADCGRVTTVPGLMQHFVVPQESIRADSVTFSPAQTHQITRVLRLRDGDAVIVLDGQGAQYRVQLAIDGREARGEIVGPAAACHEPERRVTLLVAPPKGERWEWLLQKCTEIGVARFIPLITRYTQPGAATLKPRHRDTVREAVEQCRRLLLPVIEEPQSFAQALIGMAHEGTMATLLLWEGAREQSLGAALHAALALGVSDLRFIIGPEGGFHQDEVALARNLGIPIAGLGPTILRTETAAIVAATIALTADSAH